MEKIYGVKTRLVADGKMPSKDELEYGVIYVCPDDGTCVFLCPCGCGTEIAIPINRKIWNEDIGCWDYTYEGTPDEGTLTVSPSILQRTACKSHFFIRKNRIDWC